LASPLTVNDCRVCYRIPDGIIRSRDDCRFAGSIGMDDANRQRDSIPTDLKFRPSTWIRVDLHVILDCRCDDLVHYELLLLSDVSCLMIRSCVRRLMTSSTSSTVGTAQAWNGLSSERSAIGCLSLFVLYLSIVLSV
jgi:hypothetical protein